MEKFITKLGLLIGTILVTLFSMILFGCGSNSNTTPVQAQTSTKTADYQGYYTATIDYNFVGYTATGVQMQFDIDVTGNMSNLYINHSLATTNDSKVISSIGSSNNGQLQGNVSYIDPRYGQVNVTYSGSIPIDSQLNAQFDVLFTYSGGISGTARIRGERALPVISLSSDKTTCNVGATVKIYWGSLVTQYPNRSLFDAAFETGIPSSNLSDSFYIKSAPNGSNSKFSNLFVPDVKGTYILVGKAKNGAGAEITKELTINAL